MTAWIGFATKLCTRVSVETFCGDFEGVDFYGVDFFSPLCTREAA